MQTIGTDEADDRRWKKKTARHVRKRIQSDRDLWEKFILLPDLYKRVRIDTIQSQKKHSLTLFQNRLDKFIENTRKGILYGEWNDNERLLNY